jgi:MFS family permease
MPADTTTGPPPGGLAHRLGLPNIAGRRRLAIATAVDSLGSGLFLPFSVLYFVEVGRFSLLAVGAALSLAALVAAVLGPTAGPLIDRFGSRRMVVVGNVARAVAFAAYPVAGSIPVVVVLATVVSWGDHVFWPATGALISEVADPGQRSRWFAMNRTLQNAGLAGGGLLAGVLVSAAGDTGYRTLVLVNSVSFAAAAILVASWHGAPHVLRQERTGGYRAVLRDGRFVRLVSANTVFALCHLALTVLLPVYLITSLGAPAWLAALLFGLNTALVVVTQLGVVKAVENYDAVRVLRLAAALWATSFAVFALLVLGPGTTAWWLAACSVVVFTMAEMLHLPAGSALVAELAPPPLRGRYMAANQLSWGVAGVLAPVTFTALLSWSAGLPWLVLIVATAVAWGLLGPVRRSKTAPATEGGSTTDGGGEQT